MPVRGHRSGFTLIEVLVVVAIIALLVAILIPSLSRAREKARQSVCLSNMHQLGLGFTAYAADQNGRLPMVGNFRYTLAEGEYYTGTPGGDWLRVNLGGLYPKYVGKVVGLFYCPSNKDADANTDRGKAAFLQRNQHPKEADPQWVNSHDAVNSPIGAYAYALPVASGQSPRFAGKDMYPEEVMKGSPFYDYMRDPSVLTDEQANEFLGHFPPETRGKHIIHALVTDAYFGGYQGYHMNGFNVLFGDMHAKRIPDPNRVIIQGTGGGSRYQVGELFERGKAFMVWDYFSRNP